MSAERDTAEPDTHTSAAMAAGSDVHASVFIASTANVRGRITAEESASVWYSNTLDAGAAAISIGARTNIQDNTIIRCTTAQGVRIGRDSAVGHNVMIHDCVIGDRTLIGIGSTVAAGTVVGDRVLLAAAAYEDAPELVLVRHPLLRALLCLAIATILVFGTIFALGGKML